MNKIEWIIFSVLWGMYSGFLAGYFAYLLKFPNSNWNEYIKWVYNMMLRKEASEE